MKLPLSWLADWVDLPAGGDPRELARLLTNAGFEVEAISLAAGAFTGVVVARIVSAERHPQADKLQVCRVVTSDGDGVGAATGGALTIVCGAANARVGLVSALARVGAVLPNGASIAAATLRGVASQGMLCSERELGLAENSGASGGRSSRPGGPVPAAPPGTTCRRRPDRSPVGWCPACSCPGSAR
jgi:phenylalanyl-tRNA synthetase beta chain